MIEAIHLNQRKGIHPKWWKKVYGCTKPKLTETEKKQNREEEYQRKDTILEFVPKLIKWAVFHLRQESLEPFKFMMEWTIDVNTADEICHFRSAYKELKENYKQFES